MTSKRWIVRGQDVEHAASLARTLGTSRVLASLLIARGCADEQSARAFLHPSYEQLHDPYLMLGLKQAVLRLLKAIDQGEPILIYGDYDVDGTTGTAVLLRALERALAEGYKLVVSVDCGIRAHEPLHWAEANGLDVIITDHHLPDDGAGAPPAYAVLNPNQKGCTYPDKNLAGVGVAFKLVDALLRERDKRWVVPALLRVVAI